MGIVSIEISHFRYAMPAASLSPMGKTTWLLVAAASALIASCSALAAPDPSSDPPPASPPEAPATEASSGAPATSDPAAPRPPACEATSPRPGKVEVVVTPDDGDARAIALIASAKTSIEVTIYQLSSRNVIAALVAASQRRVKVRVIQDWRESSPRTHATLGDAGVLVKTSSREFNYTHQKSILVDAKTAFVFSGNLDRQSFTSGRNFGVVLDDPDDAADFLELFEADWAARAPNLTCTRLVVAPVNARARVLALIASAKKTLDVEAMYVTDGPVVNAIVAAQKRGVAVRVLLNDPAHDLGDSSWAVSRFGPAGITVRRSGPLFVHAKLLVVDGAHAFVGSENFSDNSLDENREAGLVVSSPSADVARIVATFASDWAKSPAFSP